MTLATAAPITVPATPKNEATTAADAAARALAAICTGLSWGRFAGGGGVCCAVVGEVMGSGGRRDGWRAAPGPGGGAPLRQATAERPVAFPRAHARQRSDQGKHKGVISATGPGAGRVLGVRPEDGCAGARLDTRVPTRRPRETRGREHEPQHPAADRVRAVRRDRRPGPPHGAAGLL